MANAQSAKFSFPHLPTKDKQVSDASTDLNRSNMLKYITLQTIEVILHMREEDNISGRTEFASSKYCLLRILFVFRLKVKKNLGTVIYKIVDE